MRKIDKLFSEYGESHQNSLNKAIHFLAVPLIYFSIVGLVASIPADFLKGLVPTSMPELLPYAHFATLFSILILILFYMRLSLVITIGMAILSAVSIVGCHYIATFAPLWQVSLVIFIVSWIFQFYGHKVEGKKPSFLKDLQFLLVGPAWVMSFLFAKIGIKY
ncbi:Mpo1-like protein [Limibacter armeniacum]|uniref:Mpo1 family 2-hydroxy fatty acid dioxygenase n=1 Tax=Limibacter armeniacum TaxID=466084 RepID=UPI002FE68C71